jgi:hypothetical protein
MRWLLVFFLLSHVTLQSKQDPIVVEISEYEKELFLSPAGKYTEQDILANGHMTRTQKFKDFVTAHETHPKVGDFVCPISSTKANPECTWIIGGKSYRFCCPSCIDEFLSLAKTSPLEVLDPESYIKRQ